MSPRPYLKLMLRSRTLVGFLYPIQAQWTLYIPSMFGIRFAGALLLFPFTVGLMINIVSTELLHRPFSFSLPGGRRYFLLAHSCMMGVLAVPLVWLAHWRCPDVPVVAACGMVVASMAMAAPWETFCKWNGSHRAALVWFGLVSLAGWQSDACKAVILGAPLIVGVLGVAAAAVLVALAFRRERLRTMAMDYQLSAASVLFDGRMMKKQQQLVCARQTKEGRGWTREPLGESLGAWRKAIGFERLGSVRSPLKAITFSVAFMVTITLFLAFAMASIQQHRVASWGEAVGVLYDSLFGGIRPSVLPMLLLVPCTLVPLSTMNFPTPTRLYPLSRVRMLKVALGMGLETLSNTIVVSVCASLAFAFLAGYMAGRPVAFSPAPIWAVPLLLLPLTPAFMLVGLKSKRSDGIYPTVLTGALGGLYGGAMVGAMFALDRILTPTGICVIILVTLAALAAFAKSAATFYLRSDLVGRVGT
ncbi:MAG: hypothetical protein QM790_14275 [Nibricoccus sp.]